jgi:hypothetical protein
LWLTAVISGAKNFNITTNAANKVLDKYITNTKGNDNLFLKQFTVESSGLLGCGAESPPFCRRRGTPIKQV